MTSCIYGGRNHACMHLQQWKITSKDYPARIRTNRCLKWAALVGSSVQGTIEEIFPIGHHGNAESGWSGRDEALKRLRQCDRAVSYCRKHWRDQIYRQRFCFHSHFCVTCKWDNCTSKQQKSGFVHRQNFVVNWFVIVIFVGVDWHSGEVFRNPSASLSDDEKWLVAIPVSLFRS